MDLVVVIVLIIIVLIWKRSFKDLVFALAIIELFFRLAHYIDEMLKIKEVNSIVENIPASLSDLISTYSQGVFLTVLDVGLLACAVAFEYYLIKGWIKKK